MSIEIDSLIETYTVLKEYVPSKERQGAADTLMSVLADVLNDIDLRELSTVDSYLKRSYAEYVSEEEPSDDQDDDYSYKD